MAGCLGIGLTLAFQAAVVGSADRAAPAGNNDSLVQDFRLLSDSSTEDAEPLRIERNGAPDDDRDDNRLAADRWAIPPNQRPREPGSAVDARMSMRLDGKSEPSFGMGGIGGALLRVSSAVSGIFGSDEE